MNALKDLVAWIEEQIRDGNIDDPSYKEALEGVVKILKTDGTSLENVSRYTLKAIFGEWLSSYDAEARRDLIETMDADMLILDMAAGAATLETDTQKREAQREAIIKVLNRLGEIGVQLLLRML